LFFVVLSISEAHSNVYRYGLHSLAHFVVIVVSDSGQIPTYQLSLVTSLRGVQRSFEVLAVAKMKIGVFWSVPRCAGVNGFYFIGKYVSTFFLAEPYAYPSQFSPLRKH
jgi:hypothetical protein